MMSLTKGTDLDKMELMFDMYDVDKRGSIDKKKMTHFLRSMLNGALVYIDEMCADFDRFLGGRQSADFSAGLHKELEEQMNKHITTAVEQAFKSVTSRDNGLLSKKAFITWVKTYPKMTKFVGSRPQHLHPHPCA